MRENLTSALDEGRLARRFSPDQPPTLLERLEQGWVFTAESADWPKCESQDCTGIQLPGQRFCLAHVDHGVRKHFLDRLRPGSDVDLRGTPIDPDLLAAVLDALKEDGEPRLGEALFDRARFTGDAVFGGAQFSGNAEFVGAQFGGYVSFDGAQFGWSAFFVRAEVAGIADFVGAQFSEDAAFAAARFSENALFSGARFSGEARFTEARFSGVIGFGDTQFSGEADFTEVRFSGEARFTGTRFGGEARFTGARFGGEVSLGGAQFGGNALFGGAQFTSARVLGPLMAGSSLLLRQASFGAPIRIEVAAPKLALVGAAFQEAASLRVRFAEIALDGTSFIKPSTISCAETAFKTDLTGQLQDNALETGNRSARPRMLSLRLVDVSNLVLWNLDLSACIFQEAQNLEKLRIEGPLRFALTPRTSRVHVGRWWIPIWRPWIRRQALAEEHLLRAQQSSSPPGWNPPTVEKAHVEMMTGEPVQTLGPENLAALYRALRKGLEDQKNAPLAGDFYYGEMEMRRQSRSSPRSDRFVLWVYWLFSGYGLRASRALLAFAIVVPLFAISFWLWGTDAPKGHPVGYVTALLRTFESATSLLRPSPPGLNEFGQLLDAVLRLIGVTLLGLAVFSLRGRIKR